MMELEVVPAAISDKVVLRHLMELYLYDFSEMEMSDVDDDGLYGYRYLDHYWTESGRYPFLFRVEGKWAGFALLTEFSHFPDNPESTHAFAEFFVMRRFRRLGIGTQAAVDLFRRFPGRWEVAELPSNLSAQAFWRRVIAEYTKNDFREFVLDDDRWHGPVQVFESP